MLSCQPGIRLAAKSMPTMECTEHTSGTARPAMVFWKLWCSAHCRAELRKPSANAPYSLRVSGRRARSRRVAKSGISPVYQKTMEKIRYEAMAQKSQTRALRHCGHKVIGLG